MRSRLLISCLRALIRNRVPADQFSTDPRSHCALFLSFPVHQLLHSKYLYDTPGKGLPNLVYSIYFQSSRGVMHMSKDKAYRTASTVSLNM
jgi:hypothetical protein